MTQSLRPPTIVYPEDGSVQPVGRFLWYPTPAPNERTGSAVATQRSSGLSQDSGLTQSPLPLPDKLRGKRIAIVGGSDQTAQRLKIALQEKGANAYRFLPHGETYELAAQAFIGQTGNLDGIIDLNLEAAFTLDAKEIWEDAFSQTIALLKAVYDDWVEEIDSQRLFYVAVTHMGGQMGYEGAEFQQPLGGIWAGLAKTLHREIPNCNVKIIDFAPDDPAELGSAQDASLITQVETLVGELYHWGLFEIGYARGVRYTLAARREELLQPVHELTPSDLVLISGGGRGIGFALARALAENFGCHVVVTGRHAFPTGDELWLRLPEREWKGYEQQQFRSLREGKSLLEIRRALEHQKQLRELYSNITTAKARGLRVSYEVCDFTSQQQVAELIAHIKPQLSGVIHNAGIDAPVRLPSKSLPAFLSTIQTKVYGFLHLLEALSDKELNFFCNVGSLTGRWGGMVGQLDYAAANEGLTRLGLWAERTLPIKFPIKTLCWPTWDRLGMIANFEATLRYMTAMHREEGLYYWQRELLAPGGGEVTFIGPVGKALAPIQARGYLPIRNLPGLEQIYPQVFCLGEVQRYKPSHLLQARYTLDMRSAPCLSDFQIEATNAFPISLLLEILVHTGAWISPLERPAEHLREIRKLVVNMQALKINAAHYPIEKRAIGSWKNDAWVVEIDLLGQQGSHQQWLAHAELVYGAQLGQELPPPIAEQETGQERELPNIGLSWKGMVFKSARWRQEKREAEGKDLPQACSLHTKVACCYESDLWALPYPPKSCLPLTALENIIRAALSLQKMQQVPQQLSIANIFLGQGSVPAGEGYYLVGDGHAKRWYIVDQARNRVIYLLEGIEGKQ